MTGVGNFRNSWEAIDAELERVDDYGLGTPMVRPPLLACAADGLAALALRGGTGQRDGLQEAVEAVIAILGLQPCEGTEAVPPNARSHTDEAGGALRGPQRVRPGARHHRKRLGWTFAAPSPRPFRSDPHQPPTSTMSRRPLVTVPMRPRPLLQMQPNCCQSVGKCSVINCPHVSSSAGAEPRARSRCIE
eukprot:scaffold950_cov340-Prasinococcus_capsulatus_cf.AAC.5